MTVTVGYQTWNSASFNWDTAAAGSPVAEVCGALSTWITAINGNPSQSGKQVQLVRDHNSSTTANYRGWVVKCPLLGSATKNFYWQHFSYASTTLISKMCDDAFWANDTNNGGYGGSTSTSAAAYYMTDTKTHKHTVTTYGDITIAYGTTDGEEFFVYSNLYDGDVTNHNDSLVLAKDVFGNWCGYSGDGTSRVGAFYDPYIDRVVYSTTVSIGIFGSDGSSSLYVGGGIMLSGPSPAIVAGATRRQATAIATSAVTLQAGFPAVYGYVSLGGGDYALNLTQSGPFVRYTPV